MIFIENDNFFFVLGIASFGHYTYLKDYPLFYLSWNIYYLYSSNCSVIIIQSELRKV